MVTPAIPVTLACLVAKGAVPQVRRAVARFGSSAPRVEVLCTGPWPPYSFVPAALSDGWRRDGEDHAGGTSSPRRSAIT